MKKLKTSPGPPLGAAVVLVVAAATIAGAAAGQTASAGPAPWRSYKPPAAHQADAQFGPYAFRNGEMLNDVRLHYATLGEPHRDATGQIDNAVLVLHWTAASGATLLSPAFTSALYEPEEPLDARRYYLIFPDNVGHGQSSKPSDGLRARFPHYGYTDLVDLQYRLVTQTLGIKHLHAIVGMSMGGMNAWQWAETYPDMMDGVMAVVSLPTRVSGRNLLWRRMVSEQIRSDPEWRGGDYTNPPQGWLHAYEIMRLMIDGVPHFQSTIPDPEAADRDIAATQRQASTIDANDILYSVESSFDYDPEPNIGRIKTRLFALNFSDDEFNPDVLGALQRIVPKVPYAHYVVQQGSPNSFGHLTMAHPELWADHVGDFMREIADPES